MALGMQHLDSPDATRTPWIATRSCTGWNIRDADGEPMGHFEDERGVEMLLAGVNAHDDLLRISEAAIGKEAVARILAKAKP